MEKLVYDLSKWHSRRPIGTFTLLAFFYLIGLVLFDGSRFTDPTQYRMDTWIVSIATLDMFTLKGVFVWQWQVFTFYLIHFAFVHYGYSGFLMLFYTQGLERATNWKITYLTFFLSAILAPIILSPLLFLVLAPLTEPLPFGVLKQTYFLGSSVGIWGTIGMTVPISRKRKMYWLPIIILLFLEFFLKLAFINNADITANIVHLIVFFTTYSISRIFFEFKHNDQVVGKIAFNGKFNWILVFLLIFHALIMFIHFVDTMGLTDHNLLFYLFS